MSWRRKVAAALVIAAALIAALFLFFRSDKDAPALAVYSRPETSVPNIFFLEAFTVKNPKSIAVKVLKILGGPDDEEEFAFEQIGQKPALVKVSLDNRKPQRLLIHTDTEHGPADVEILANTKPIQPTQESISWPLKVRCGTHTVLLYAETGIPEIGVSNKIAALLDEQDVAKDAVITINLGGQTSEGKFSQSKVALLEVLPKSPKSWASLSISDANATCSSNFLFQARSAGVVVRDIKVLSFEQSRLKLHVNLSTRFTHLYALVARRKTTEQAAGELLDVQVLDVKNATTEMTLKSSGPGIYQIRFTPDPLDSSFAAKGTDTLLIAENHDMPHEPEVPRIFILANLAVRQPLLLQPLANTASFTRARVKSERDTRDAILLSLFSACLFGLLALMLAEVIIKSRRFGQSLAQEERVIAISFWKAALPTVIMLVVLGFAIVALVFLLRTL